MSVITNHIGALEYLTAEGISAPHCFTTRFGGVSEGYLDSLNIGIHRGDEWKNVLKNYEILGKALILNRNALFFPTRRIRILFCGWEKRSRGVVCLHRNCRNVTAL